MYDRDLAFGPRTRLDSSGPAFWATKSRAWSLKSTHWKKTKICRNKDILSLDPASALEIHHLVYSIFMGIWKIINSIKIHPSYKIQSTWYLWSFEPYSSMYYWDMLRLRSEDELGSWHFPRASPGLQKRRLLSRQGHAFECPTGSWRRHFASGWLATTLLDSPQPQLLHLSTHGWQKMINVPGGVWLIPDHILQWFLQMNNQEHSSAFFPRHVCVSHMEVAGFGGLFLATPCPSIPCHFACMQSWVEKILL